MREVGLVCDIKNDLVKIDLPPVLKINIFTSYIEITITQVNHRNNIYFKLYTLCLDFVH